MNNAFLNEFNFPKTKASVEKICRLLLDDPLDWELLHFLLDEFQDFLAEEDLEMIRESLTANVDTESILLLHEEFPCLNLDQSFFAVLEGLINKGIDGAVEGKELLLKYFWWDDGWVWYIDNLIHLLPVSDQEQLLKRVSDLRGNTFLLERCFPDRYPLEDDLYNSEEDSLMLCLKNEAFDADMYEHEIMNTMLDWITELYLEETKDDTIDHFAGRK